MKRYFLRGQVAAVLALAACVVGCGGSSTPDPGLLADPELSIDEAAELVGRSRGQASRAILRLAPELHAAATWYEEQAKARRAEGDDTGARAALVRAAGYLDQANQVTNAVRGRRTLQFPGDRSLGSLQVRAWEPGSTWRVAGEAQGTVNIEAEHMVQLGVSSEITLEDVHFLATLGPGAIQYLSLSDRNFGDEVLPILAELVGLRDVSLLGLGITDEGMAYLGDMKHLRHLNIMGTGISDAGIQALGHMPSLAEIAVGETQITDRAVLALSRQPALRTILFRRNHLTDVGVDWIAKGPPLERLWLHGRGITDFGVPLLAEMESLKELVLLETSITDLGVRSLRQALPNTRIDVVS